MATPPLILILVYYNIISPKVNVKYHQKITIMQSFFSIHLYFSSSNRSFSRARFSIRDT